MHKRSLSSESLDSAVRWNLVAPALRPQRAQEEQVAALPAPPKAPVDPHIAALDAMDTDSAAFPPAPPSQPSPTQRPVPRALLRDLARLSSAPAEEMEPLRQAILAGLRAIDLPTAACQDAGVMFRLECNPVELLPPMPLASLLGCLEDMAGCQPHWPAWPRGRVAAALAANILIHVRQPWCPDYFLPRPDLALVQSARRAPGMAAYCDAFCAWFCHDAVLDRLPGSALLMAALMDFRPPVGPFDIGWLAAYALRATVDHHEPGPGFSQHNHDRLLDALRDILQHDGLRQRQVAQGDAALSTDAGTRRHALPIPSSHPRRAAMLALLARIDPVAGMRSLEAPAVQEAILDAMRQAGIPGEVDYHSAVLQRLLCGDESMPLQTLLGCMADLAQHPESERCTRDKRLLAEAMRKAVVRLCWQT